MSTTYSARNGDTFDTVSRRVFGNGSEAGNIRAANPGLDEPLSGGAQVFIPSGPSPLALSVSGEGDEVALLIDQKRFRFWTSIRIQRALDTVSSISLTVPFDADNDEVRGALRPFSYKSVQVFIGSELVFTGTLVGVEMVAGSSKTASVSCYATPGVLMDCTMPPTAYPIEFLDQTLPQIVEGMAKVFGIKTIIPEGTDTGGPFEEATCETARSVFDFLSDLAKQRGLLLTNDPQGNLVITEALVEGESVADFTQGLSPVVEVATQFDGQQYFSTVSGVESAVAGLGGDVFTVKNTHADGLMRPHVFSIDNAKGGDIKRAIESKVGRMFGNSAKYEMEVATWRDANEALLAPNRIVTLIAPDAGVYNRTTLLIRSVELTVEGGTNRRSARLDLSLLGAFNGQIPKEVPWAE